MKILRSFFLLFIVSNVISAQWNQENFSSSTWYQACVYFLNETHGWISGGSNSEGNIYSTTDGGNTWTKFTFPDIEELESIFFIDEQTGWAVGDSGKIIHTTTGGSEWVLQNSGTDSYLSSVYFVDENKGWVTYSTSTGTPPTDYVGHLLYTSDGGNNWTEQMQAEDYSFKDVFFIDENYGWIACYNFGSFSDIFLTTDGGNNWVKRSLNTVWAFFYEIHFVNKNVGWIVGESSTILKSTDGGYNWIVQNEYGSQNLYSCFAIDENKVYTVGRKGTILCSSNGGSDWEEQISNTEQSLNSVYFTNENRGWIVGYGTCLSTENGGVTKVELENNLPLKISLKQNYPNPFNPLTKIEYQISRMDNVSLKIYDTLGREVKILVNKSMQPGRYEIDFDGNNLTSGVYFYVLETDTKRLCRKMLLIK